MERTSVSYDVHLVSYAIQWKSVLLLDALRSLGVSLKYSDFISNDPKEKERGGLIANNNGTALRHAADLGDPAIIAYILQHGDCAQALELTKRYIPAIRSPHHRMIRSLIHKIADMHDSTKINDSIEAYLKAVDVLMDAGFTLDCRAQHERLGDVMILDQLLMSAVTVPALSQEATAKLLQQLRKRGAMASPLIIWGVMSVFSNEKSDRARVVAVLAALVESYGSILKVPQLSPCFKTLLAIVVNEIAAFSQLTCPDPALAVSFACCFGRLEMLKLLHENNEHVLLQRSMGTRLLPLHAAIGANQLDIVTYLLELTRKGVDIGLNKKAHGLTALDMAARLLQNHQLSENYAIIVGLYKKKELYQVKM